MTRDEWIKWLPTMLSPIATFLAVWIGWQGLTGVRDVHRGRGLGKWLKAEMLLRVRRDFPEVRVVSTGNASSNEAMLSINERLGFRTHKEPVIVEMTREALEGYVRDHTGHRAR